MILSQAVKNVAELSMPEERPECIEVMSNLESLSEDDPAFIALVTCDVLLSSADWTTTWAAALSEASSVETLADKLLNKLGLDKETIQCQANKLVKGKPMDSAGGAKHESTSAPKTETGDKPEDGDHGDNGSIITLLSTNVFSFCVCVRATSSCELTDFLCQLSPVGNSISQFVAF